MVEPSDKLRERQFLKDMPLHTIGDLSEGIKVMRVVGGWIYRFQEGISVAAVFVPERDDI